MSTWEAQACGTTEWRDARLNHVWPWLMICHLVEAINCFVECEYCQIIKELGSSKQEERDGAQNH